MGITSGFGNFVLNLSNSMLLVLTKIELSKVAEILNSNELMTAIGTISLAPVVLAIRYSIATTDTFAGVKSISEIVYVAVSYFNGLMTTLGLRKRRRYWGTVYDAVTKQPLDPAIVKLINVDTGKMVEQAVTDLYGKFGFLDRPGRYRIEAAKTHYRFPSEIVTGNADNLFDNVYHGEVFEISTNSNVIAPNIPMDQMSDDWNQEEKKRLGLGNINLRLNLIISRFLSLLFWIGFIAIFFIFFSHPSVLNGIFILTYSVLVWLNRSVPNPQLWGRVIVNGVVAPGLLLELYHQSVPGVVLANALTNQNGKFFLKTSPGQYTLKIKSVGDKKTVVIAEKEITVGNEGVVGGIISV